MYINNIYFYVSTSCPPQTSLIYSSWISCVDEPSDPGTSREVDHRSQASFSVAKDTVVASLSQCSAAEIKWVFLPAWLPQLCPLDFSNPPSSPSVHASLPPALWGMSGHLITGPLAGLRLFLTHMFSSCPYTSPAVQPSYTHSVYLVIKAHV